MEFYGRQFVTGDYTYLKLCHHITSRTVHLHAEFRIIDSSISHPVVA